MADTFQGIVSIGQFRLRKTGAGHVVDFKLTIYETRHETMTVELHFDAVPDNAVHGLTAMMEPFEAYFADWLDDFQTNPAGIDLAAITRFDESLRQLFAGADFAGWAYREMRLNGNPVNMVDLLEIALHIRNETARRSLLKKAA